MPYPGWSFKVSWVTDNKSPPNAWILCQGPDCGGRIVFNKEEILSRRAAGVNTSTPCRYCGWHPAFPPEPWNEYPPAQKEEDGFAPLRSGQ